MASVRPLWFGSEDRPLFGWLHVPENELVRGCVLLNAPLGIEAVSAHTAYRRLADRLAEVGFAVLRFDYDGTGDSAGQADDPGRVEAWLGSIREAEGLMRGLGLKRMSAIGMRVGATLVAEALGSWEPVLDDLVLWDPCASGRTFLREQSALWSFAFGTQSNNDGSIETPGLVFDKETVADLSSITIADSEGPLAKGVLLLRRANRKGNRQMNERLELPHIEHQAILGQEEFVDVTPDAAVLPAETIEIIVEWLAARAAGNPLVRVDPDAIGRDWAVVGSTSSGATIEEHALALGPLGLFGIVTSQRDDRDTAVQVSANSFLAESPAKPDEPPTLFFLNAGTIDHVGPSRLWVQLSRAWAAAGFRSIRFDLSGLGDSPVHAGRPAGLVFPAEALTDLRDVLTEALPEDQSNAVLIGLCSGAYQAIEGGIVHKVRGVCALNLPRGSRPLRRIAFGYRLPEIDTATYSNGFAEAVQNDPGRSSAGLRWRKELLGNVRFVSAFQRLPGAVWWLLNRVAFASSPARSLVKVVDVGANVLVIAGSDEADQLTRGEALTMRKLRRARTFRMDVIPDLEHTLFERHSRDKTVGVLTEHVLSKFGT